MMYPYYETDWSVLPPDQNRRFVVFFYWNWIIDDEGIHFRSFLLFVSINNLIKIKF